jgi:hypothetical protein
MDDTMMRDHEIPEGGMPPLMSRFSQARRFDSLISPILREACDLAVHAWKVEATAVFDSGWLKISTEGEFIGELTVEDLPREIVCKFTGGFPPARVHEHSPTYMQVRETIDQIDQLFRHLNMVPQRGPISAGSRPSYEK